MQDIFEARREYSLGRVNELKDRISVAAKPIQLEGLTIFTVGSYGRLEASEHSDIDLFFVYEKGPTERRTNEMRLFGRLIELVEELDFPKLSNDAQYLQSHVVKDVLAHLGGAEDDSRNYFTTRMLLLLESRPLYGQEAYQSVIAQILESYIRDYPTHASNFRPWFLLNDIMRFWKTLLLNYENKRNRDQDRDEQNPKPRVKNFKLKYSRATTCFATICAIGSLTEAASLDSLTEIVAETPRERLLRVKDQQPKLEPQVSAVLDEYSWFLEQTALPTEALEDMFRDRESRRSMFDRAESYADRIFKLLHAIDELSEGKLIRALVV